MNHANVLIGICLGWDHCGEHQGVFKPSTEPPYLNFYDHGSSLYLFGGTIPPRTDKRSLDRLLDIGRSSEDGLITSWSRNEFGICVRGRSFRTCRSALREIRDALENGDALLYFARAHLDPFGKHGACILIRPRLYQHDLERVLQE